MIRLVSLEEADVTLRKDQSGEFIVTKLFPPSEEEEDEEGGEFAYDIQIDDVELYDVDFTLSSYGYWESDAEYDTLNLDDFRVRDLQGYFGADVSIRNNVYELLLGDLLLFTNVRPYRRVEATGYFFLDPQEIFVEGFELRTDATKLTLDLAVSGLNIFGDSFERELPDARTELRLGAEPFHFRDLRAVIPSLEFPRRPRRA